jgi:hypothetical protein
MSPSEFIGLIGGITGLIGGITALSSVFWIRQQTNWIRQQTRTAEHQLFISVARDVQERYSKLYPILASLPQSVEQLSDEQRQAISQYANLCAEEYLWKQKGIVQQEIWDVWEFAIADKFTYTIIGEVWKQNLRKDKYYRGFAEFIEGILKCKDEGVA